MESDRRRAWILLHSKDPESTLESLRRLFPQGGDQFVVVRADLVMDEGRSFPFNIFVPVDAESDPVLEEVVASILNSSPVTEHVVAKVKAHIPFPPHDAQGYITVEEAELGKDEDIEPGRQGASPGRNPWG
ncbi:MAG: hypothetical protein PVI59_07835 [Anaerolineae bacterium]|jgi:hypothetical protein